MVLLICHITGVVTECLGSSDSANHHRRDVDDGRVYHRLCGITSGNCAGIVPDKLLFYPNRNINCYYRSLSVTTPHRLCGRC